MLLKGIPASRGIVKGKVNIVINEKQFGNFKADEILVTKQTSPAWTPIIAVAKAVVTEQGGQLCHAAIVAREYGIPCVVGVKDATKLLKMGQKISIDGFKGLVVIN